MSACTRRNLRMEYKRHYAYLRRFVCAFRLRRPTYAVRSVKAGLHFERKPTAHTQTFLRTWGAFSRPPMPIYAVGIVQAASVNTPTIRRLLCVDAGLSLANSPQPISIRKLLRDI